MTLVSVLRDRYVRGWPRHADGDRAYVVPLGQALERDYTTDAHFAAYRTPNRRRLVREALDQGVAVELTAIVFDVDCAATHGTKEPAPYSWRREERAKVMALREAYPKPFFYETRGGYRLVYRQDEPTILRTQLDALEWSRIYAVAVAHLEQRFGIVADPACNDWQRLYRLPRATRDPGGQPENWPTDGDPNAIGALVIDASWADVAKAQKQAARAFRSPRHEVSTFAGGGDGLLFWALKLRGEIIGPAPRGGWICRCPNRRQHTSNTDGSDSTVVFPPTNGEIGALHCKHAHCVNQTLRDWLRCFSDPELEAARAAAGIVRTRAA